MKLYFSSLIGVFLIGFSAWIFLSGFLEKPNPSGPGKPWTKVSLGRQLFFDPILSADSSVSCASCHKPEFGFADTLPFSKGVGGKPTKRNTPSVLNMANRDLLFWDGRANSLEHQALFPIRDPGEMNLPIPKAIARLNKSKLYKKAFLQVFGKVPSEKRLGDALAAYEASLETGNSPFDLYMNGKADLDPDAKAGHALFVGKAGCFDCHFSPDFTGDEFKNIGLYNGKEWNDPGRFGITKDPKDLGKFKVPGLRNVARTAPYMHNGAFPTLRAVIDYYASPEAVVSQPIGTDSTIRKGLVLNEKEKQQLEAFLKSLSSPLPGK
jgi:cytochrome c peroxidase